MSEKRSEGIHSGLLLFGFVLGLIAGGLAALFKAPRSGSATRQQISDAGQTLRNKVESTVTADPLAESIAEGKAAARRRRQELGLDDSK